MMKSLWLAVLVASALAACGARSVASGDDRRTVVAADGAPGRSAAFWAWFVDRAATLHDDPDLGHVMEAINGEVAKTHPGVIAEIGSQGAQRLLVLSADGHREFFPLVEELYAARPSVPGWNIVAFRQRSKHADVIEMAGTKIDPAQLRFESTRNGDKLDIVVFVPGFTTVKEMGAALYVTLDNTVGEYDMETKIGVIDFKPIGEAPASAAPLTDLAAAVDKAFPPSK